MTNAPSQNSCQRIHGFDLIRLISFFAIATFHVSLIHYYTRDIDIASESIIIRAVEQFARALAFSGFTIIFLTSILTAYSGSSLTKRINLFAFLLVGWVIFSYLISGLRSEFFVWDIYPLIFVGILIMSIAEKFSYKLFLGFSAIGFALLWIPFWEFREVVNLSTDWKVVLGFADCEKDISEWPVLPWIGLIWFGYTVGYLLRITPKEKRGQFFQLRPKEAAVWLVFLTLGASQWGTFFNVGLGEFFACDAYRQPPVKFWGHFIYVIFAIRISIEPRVQAFLASQKLFRSISGLAISRKFWLAYLLNYLFAHVISWCLRTSGVESTDWNVPVIAFIAVFFLPMTEVLTRAVIFIALKLKKIITPQ